MKIKSPLVLLGLVTATLVPMVVFNLLDVFYFSHTTGALSVGEDFNFESESEFSKTYNKTSVTYSVIEKEMNGYKVPAHLLEVKLKRLSDFRSHLATDEEGNYGVNITGKMQDIVNEAKEKSGHNILGAISGDFSFWSSSRDGFVVRNGVVYRNTARYRGVDLVMSKDHTVSFLKRGSYSLDAGLGRNSRKYWQISSFGPVLMENGEIMVEEDAEINGNTWVNNQRACIGFVNWDHFYLLATEAVNRTSKTLCSYRLYDLAKTLEDYGCTDVYNLDGGYSSGLAVDNEVVFKPTRNIGDIFYVVDSEE